MGQYQNVPGPSQDEFNAQTQAIAKFEGGLALPGGDCNNATETGRYKATATNTNTPAGTHWNIDVIKYNDNQITQTAHRVYGSSQVWERAYLSGTWSSWQQLATKGDFITKEVSASFSNGTASTTISDVPSSAKVIISRKSSTSSSLILAAQVTSANTISMSAWDASAKASFTGTVNVYLFIDCR